MKKRLMQVSLSAIAAALLAVCLAIAMPTAYARASLAAPENLYRVDSGEFDEYTDSVKPFGVDVVLYADEYQGANAEIRYNVPVGGRGTYVIKDDDPIVKLVPEHLFKTVGKTFYIGRQYGFLVDTCESPDYLDRATELAPTNNLHSTVMLFTIEIQDNMPETFDHLRVKINPVFQGEFVYIEKAADASMCYFLMESKNFFDIHYIGYDGVEFPAGDGDGTGYVAAMPGQDNDSYVVTFRQYEKYFLTDIGCTASLYNENHANPFNSDYVLEQDMGAYFSQMDYENKGRVYKPGSKPTFEQVVNVGAKAASVTWDIVKQVRGALVQTAVKSNPWTGIAYAAVKSGIDIAREIDKIEEAKRGTWQTNEKTLTYTPCYTDRNKQIEQGYFNKDLSFGVEDTLGRPFYLGNGDHFTFDYQISYGTSNWDTRYATALYVSAVSITEAGDDPAISEPIWRSEFTVTY